MDIQTQNENLLKALDLLMAVFADIGNKAVLYEMDHIKMPIGNLHQLTQVLEHAGTRIRELETEQLRSTGGSADRIS